MQQRDIASVDLTHRDQRLEFQRSARDEMSYTFPLTSEAPYRRQEGQEILVHRSDTVNLDFLNSGNAPLLMDHDRKRQIGVVERAWLDDQTRRVYVRARFSRSAEAQIIRQDVEDGIRRNVSAGYRVTRAEPSRERTGEYLVTSWRPMEASIVSVPADTNVGFGRADQPQEGIMPATQTTGAPENGASPSGGGMPAVVVTNDDNTRDDTVNVEVQRAERAEQVSEIRALAASHNMSDMALEFIGEAERAGEAPSLARFRAKLRASLPADTPLVNNDVGLTRQETQNFSLLKLVRTMVRNPSASDIAAAGRELEACRAAEDKFEGETRGLRVPEEIMRNWTNFRSDDGQTSDDFFRAQMVTTTHTNIQDVDHLAGRFIENLRNRSSILRAGVTMLTGLSGNIEIPGGNANSVAAWLAAEADDAAETNPTFRKVEMAIKDIAGFTQISRRMMIQSTIAIEAYVRSQLLTALALGIDKAGLEGSGLTGIPEGIKNTTGIGSVDFAADTPTRDELIDMWSELADVNADMGNLAWIYNSLMAAGLMKTKLDAGSGRFLLDGPDSPLLSTPTIRSNQATTGDVYFGNWSDALMGMWGGLDLDRSTEGDVYLSGGVQLRAIQSVDFAVARTGSFCYGVNAP